MQLFSIHGFHNESIHPFVLVLMTKRTKAMYCAVLNSVVQKAIDKFSIVLNPHNISTDFERASISAFEEVFPTAIVTGCHFHLSQSVIRKVNEMGLKARYRSDPEFALHVRMLYSMAYLRPADVSEALELIRSSMPADGQPLVEYFDQTYVGGHVVRGTTVRRPPMYPPSMWNVVDRFVNELPTTTNRLEAWHRRMQTIIVIDHPSFYDALHQLRKEQRHVEVEIQRAGCGFRPQRRRRSVNERKLRLTTLISDLTGGRKDITEFLRGVAHAFGNHGDDENSDDSTEEEGSTPPLQVIVVNCYDHIELSFMRTYITARHNYTLQ
jgi:hypothetical protein